MNVAARAATTAAGPHIATAAPPPNKARLSKVKYNLALPRT